MKLTKKTWVIIGVVGVIIIVLIVWLLSRKKEPKGISININTDEKRSSESGFSKTNAPSPACEYKLSSDIKECDNNYVNNSSNPTTAGTAYNTYKNCVQDALNTYKKCTNRTNKN